MLNKKKLFIISLVIYLTGFGQANAETLSEVEFPKPPAYRVGISELPENQYVQAKEAKTNLEKAYAQIDGSRESAITDMTYADLSINKLSKEIGKELEYEEADMVADLSLLWQGAATQSDTINFALYKLANPDADKPDGASIKKVLTTIASMSTLVGASMANPVFAGSSLIGGNILNIMSQDTKALNYKYTRVNDADMIILIRKIEDLQQNAVNLYYDYMSAKKQLEMTTKLVEDRQRKFELAQKNNAPRELIVITDAYYRTAIDKQRTAKSDFFSKRAALEQFVGNEAFVQFESELAAREKGEKLPENAQADDKTSEEYSNTIQNVENYTRNIQNETPDVQTLSPLSDQPQVYSEPVNDPNLDKLPDLEPLDETSNADNSRKSEAFSAGVSGAANIEQCEDLSGIQDKLAFGKKNTSLKTDETNDSAVVKKSKKEKKVKEKKTKVKKEKSKTETKTKKEETIIQQPRKKYPRNSTKDLIFLHGQDKSTVKRMSNPSYTNQSSAQQSTPDTSGLLPLAPIVSPSPVQENNIKYNLPPLDAIQIPSTNGHGYSIHDWGESSL